MRAAADPRAFGLYVSPRGGPGALSAALAAAARAAGATIRTGADVVRLETKDGAITTVVLASGDRIDAPVVVSGLDPKRTFLTLLAPADLGPEFRKRVRNIRARGVTAKVNLALDRLPAFTALKDRGADAAAALSGRIIVGHEIDALERAYDASKYGRTSEAPFIEATIPSLLDPSLAPEGKHVLSALVQFVPYHSANGDIATDRDALGDRVVQALARHAPDLPGLVKARQVITPRDLESDWGLTEGHLFQGEEALDQFFTMRPILGWARYQTPVRGLFLCGAGTHPGGGLTGANGRNAARAVSAHLKS
jgi:phytoene dehydrogenase-like protein